MSVLETDSRHSEILQDELNGLLKTRTFELLDVYRLRKRVIPMIDKLLVGGDLKTKERLIMSALKEDLDLIVLTQLLNENKLIFKQMLKSFMKLLC